MHTLAAQHHLWHALQDFSWQGEGQSWTFAQRLGSEYGWSPEYTNRVLEEYRRFLFLACVAGHPVTPSVDVDEAWHLHLVYTESYWNDLCQKTLGRSLHHGPTRGGCVEDQKYALWYEQTRNAYEKWFHERPPEDIWPDAVQRFGPKQQYRMIRRGDFFLLPRRLINGHFTPTFLVIICFACTLMAFSESEKVLLIFVGILILAMLAQCFAAWRKKKRRKDSRNGNGGCNANSGPHDSGCTNSGCSSSGCGSGGCGGGD